MKLYCEFDRGDSIIISDRLDSDDELMIDVTECGPEVYLSTASARALAMHILSLLPPGAE